MSPEDGKLYRALKQYKMEAEIANEDQTQKQRTRLLNKARDERRIMMPKHYGLQAEPIEIKDWSKLGLRELEGIAARRVGSWIAWRVKVLLRLRVR